MDAVVDDALDAHRTEPRADVAGVRRGLHAPADRVANTEGALTGPRRSPESYWMATTVRRSPKRSQFAERSRWLMTNTIPSWTSR